LLIIFGVLGITLSLRLMRRKETEEESQLSPDYP
jgi:hypothetical protein